ncbi:MAG: peptidase M14, partial [Acidobacteriota bacterium]
AKLAQTLMLSGIEVHRAEASFTNGRSRDYQDGELQSRQFPAGSYIVSLDQPAKRLAKTLLEKMTPQDKEFLDEQRRRNERRQSEQFYDVTAWALPLIYDQECFVAEESSAVRKTLLTEPPRLAGQVRGGPAKLAYLIPWGTQAATMALADLFRQDIRVHSTDKAFKLNGRDFPAGSLIVKVKDNPESLHRHMSRVAATYGIEVDSTDSAWVEGGPNFGSNAVKYLPRPRVALVWNLPTSPNSAGWTRYVIERQFGYPVTTIRADQIRSADLSRYNVIILPDTFSGYSQQFGDGAVIREWVQRGGVLIGLGGAINWLADEKVNLLSIKREKREKIDQKGDAAKSPEKSEGGANSTPSDPVERAIQPVDEYPSSTPGALLRVRVDREHWLGFGYGETTTVMVDSNRIYSLIKLDRGTNVAFYQPREKMVASGHLWDDALRQLPNKSFLVHSRSGLGHVIGFVEDPNYRAFMDGLNGFMMNALFLGPGH